MEKVMSSANTPTDVKMSPHIASIGKPPWTTRPHSGRLERLILQLGAGSGKFSEITGIPRSIGCIGNNSFLLRREPLSVDRMKEIIADFINAGGEELWLTNYDRVEDLTSIAAYAVEAGTPEVYAVVKLEDLELIQPIKGVRFIAELEYSPENIQKLGTQNYLYGALVMATARQYNELKALKISFPGELYVDILYPGSARKLDFNVIGMKMVFNQSAERYHDCLGGTIAITADGYLLPCPLLRNYVVADITITKLRNALRKKILKEFWEMTKDKIEVCSTCPFRYICHDCRALEYQATGEINGIEYCQIRL